MLKLEVTTANRVFMFLLACVYLASLNAWYDAAITFHPASYSSSSSSSGLACTIIFFNFFKLPEQRCRWRRASMLLVYLISCDVAGVQSRPLDGHSSLSRLELAGLAWVITWQGKIVCLNNDWLIHSVSGYHDVLQSVSLCLSINGALVDWLTCFTMPQRMTQKDDCCLETEFSTILLSPWYILPAIWSHSTRLILHIIQDFGFHFASHLQAGPERMRNDLFFSCLTLLWSSLRRQDDFPQELLDIRMILLGGEGEEEKRERKKNKWSMLPLCKMFSMSGGHKVRMGRVV